MTTVLKIVPGTPPGQTTIVLVDQPSDWPDAGARVMSAAEFLARPIDAAHASELIINLCRSYKYLSVGYYCSLMAEARGQQVLPSVKTINDL